MDKACQRAKHLDGAGTDLAGEADHHAAMRGQIEILHHRRHRQIFHHQHRFAGLALPARIHLAEASAEHHLHQMRAVDLIGAARAHQFAIAQHRDAVADLEHLTEPVRDVDDRLAFGFQRTQCIEDPFDLDVGQRRGRLVEDEDAGVACQHPRKLDKLATADAELRHRRLQRQIAQPDTLERRPRPVTKFLAAVKQRHLAVAEPDVVQHRERRSEAQLLCHQRDAELLRVLRIADLDRLAIDADDTGIGRVHAGDDFHQRALACSVFAADRADFLRIERDS